MTNKRLHIISFDIPSPPDYGGVIDIYYKIKALHEAGIGIILHAYEYRGRKVTADLEEMCVEVHTYDRNMSWKKAVGTTPFIMASRKDEALIRRLEMDDHPVLFEGMHTGIHLAHPVMKGRSTFLRMHNIEWNYYRLLSKSEHAPLRKLYYYAESLRLNLVRAGLGKADMILSISRSEQLELKQEFDNVEYLPAFHPNDQLRCPTGKGGYALYHGNLSVAENQNAVEWLVQEVFKDTNISFKVAGSKPPSRWGNDWPDNIELIADPEERKMSELIEGAHIHVLPTFQPTGVKLKLLRALFNGRHVLVNPEMTAGSGLERLCTVARTANEMRDALKELQEMMLTPQQISDRQDVLDKEYNNALNASRLIEWLYPHP